MSRVVDNRVVEMEFDNANFERNVSTSLSTLDRLKAALSFKGTEDNFDVVEQSVANLGKSFSVMEQIGVGALRNFGGKIETWAENTIKTMSGVKQAMAGFEKYTTLTESAFTLQGQGFKTKEISNELRRLTWFTDETSYNLGDMVDNMAKFTSKGLGLKESSEDMMGIALWAASAGQNAQTASRAMYQLSQAMAGPMNLMDWRSIENANMNTAEFQKLALETATAIGTVKKNADGLYKSIAEGSQYSDWFSADKGFRNSLAGKWFTPEVQSAVYRKYTAAVDDIYQYIKKHPGTLVADAIESLDDQLDQFSVHALLMAQQSKTWADTVNATADAVSTKWSGIFTHIFGNAKQSTKFFSALTEEFYTLFAEPMNGLLDVFLTWRQAFGRKEWQNSFISALQSVNTILGSIGDTIDKFAFGERAKKLVEYSQKVKKAYAMTGTKMRRGKSGTVIGSDRMLIENPADEYEVMMKARADVLMNITHKFTEFSEKVQKAAEDTSFFERITLGVLSVFGLIRDAISGLWKALDPFKPLVKGAISKVIGLVLKLADAISRLYRQTHVNKSFERLFKLILAPLTNFQKVATTFINRFIPKFKAKWNDFTSHFSKTGDRFSTIKDKIGEVFSKIEGWWRGLFANITSKDIDKAIDGIFNTLDKIKQWVYDLIGVKDDDGFAAWVDRTLSNIASSFEKFKKTVGNFATSIWEDLKKYGGEAFQWITDHWEDVSATMKEIFAGIGGFVGAFWKAIKGFFSKGDADDSTSGLKDVIDAFKTFGEILGNVIGTIAASLKPLADGLKNTIQSMSLDNAGNFLKGGGIAALGIAFYKWSKNFKKSNWVLGFGNVLESLGKTLDGFTKLLDAKALKEAAVGIAVLVGSLFVLISMPADKLGAAATVMALIIEILANSLKKLSAFTTSAKIDAKGFNFSKSGAGGVLFMAALSFVAIAAVLKMVAAIPQADLYKAVTVIAVIAGIMTLMMKTIANIYAAKGDSSKSITKNSKNVTLTGIKAGPAATILAFAAFIGVVIFALRKLTDMIGTNQNRLKLAIMIAAGIMFALVAFLTIVSQFYKSTEKTTGTTITKSGNSTSLWKDILAIAAGLYIVAVAFDKLAGIKGSKEHLVAVGAFILAFMGVVVLLAKVSKGKSSFDSFGKFAKGMLTIAAVIGALALIVNELSKIKDTGKLVAAVASVGILGALLAAFAFVAKKILSTDKAIARFSKMAVSLIAVSGALAIAAGAMYAIGQLDWGAWGRAILGITALSAILMGVGYLSAGKIGDGVITFTKALLYLGLAVAAVGVGFLAAAAAIQIFSDDTFDAKKAGENITKVLDEIVAKIPQWVFVVIKAITESLIAAVPAAIMAFVDSIGNTLAMLIEKDPITGKMKIETLVENAVKVFVAIVNGINNSIDEILEAVGALVLNLLIGFGSWVKDNADAISNALSDAIEGFMTIILGLFDPLGEKIFGDAWGDIKQSITDIAKPFLGVTVLAWLASTFVPGVLSALKPIALYVTGLIALIAKLTSDYNAQEDRRSRLMAYAEKVAHNEGTDAVNKKYAELMQYGADLDVDDRGYLTGTYADEYYSKHPKEDNSYLRKKQKNKLQATYNPDGSIDFKDIGVVSESSAKSMQRVGTGRNITGTGKSVARRSRELARDTSEAMTYQNPNGTYVGKVIKFNQTINSTKPLDATTIYRYDKNTLMSLVNNTNGYGDIDYSALARAFGIADANFGG